MIKELTSQEAEALREKVKRRFRKSNFKGNGFKINQHLPAYQSLADDIIRVVPGSEASVSTNRLRKLFYYTDPSVCAPEKLEKPSFGDDFIEVLLMYVQRKRTAVPPALWVAMASLLLLLAIAKITWSRFNRPDYWPENFDDVSLEGLNSRGWEILDYDSVALSNQSKPGYFTAYTERGDYWATPPDSPVITNLLIKKLNCKSGKITIKIDDFNPTQDYQQAGIILLNRDMDRTHNIRITFVASHTVINPDQRVQMIKRERGTSYEQTCLIHHWSDAPPETALYSPIWLQIQFSNNRFLFYYHAKEEHGSFIEIGGFDFDFEPYYVAVGAFRGIRDSKRALNTSKSIPAFIDYVKVESL